MASLEEIEEIESQWEEARNKYGHFQIIDSPNLLPQVDKAQIWTEFWRQDQFIANTYVKVDEFDGDVTSYYVFEKPYLEPENSIFLITTIWEYCDDCDGDDESCPNCEGEGSRAIDIV